MTLQKYSWVASLLLVACGDNGTAETGSQTTSTGDATTGQVTTTGLPTTGEPTTANNTTTSTASATASSSGTSGTSGTGDTGDTMDPSAATTGDTPVVCGDGIVADSEACDDGNKDNTDACLDTCVAAACGDSFVQAGVETCDDANPDNTDDCLDTCVAAACGDGFIQTEVEACDDGNPIEEDGCLTTCVMASCGDKVVWDGVEGCDDGNMVDNDACSNTCVAANCGDGIVQMGEECDDKNDVDTDACLNTCKSASCGDGVVQAGKEDCDEGGANNDETGPCRTDCTLCDCQGDDLMGKTCGDFDFSCGSLACDGCGFDTSGCASPGVPNFQGKVGPAFNDGCWQQCEGYLDVNGGDDIPVAWGDDCAGVDFSRIRLACGTGLSSYRYITVEKNVFKDGLIGYPENGLISEAKDQNGNGFAIDNVIYAENNQPNTGRSWWNGGNGCDENSTNITFNNFCTYEASNCFGQNINGDRFVWVYVAP